MNGQALKPKEWQECQLRHEIEEIYRIDSRRIFASLVRLLRDFDAAEEAMQEAFAAAFSQWDQAGIPITLSSPADFQERLESVLAVVYLIFNEGYSASSGDSLTRAVAVAMNQGPAAGIARIDAIFEQGNLVEYHLAHAAKADLLRRLGYIPDARIAYEQALAFVKQEPERRFLLERLASL